MRDSTNAKSDASSGYFCSEMKSIILSHNAAVAENTTEIYISHLTVLMHTITVHKLAPLLAITISVCFSRRCMRHGATVYPRGFVHVRWR
jgi:hypothetical protein